MIPSESPSTSAVQPARWHSLLITGAQMVLLLGMILPTFQFGLRNVARVQAESARTPAQRLLTLLEQVPGAACTFEPAPGGMIQRKSVRGSSARVTVTAGSGTFPQVQTLFLPSEITALQCTDPPGRPGAQVTVTYRSVQGARTFRLTAPLQTPLQAAP